MAATAGILFIIITNLTVGILIIDILVRRKAETKREVEKKEGWVNLYMSPKTGIYPSEIYESKDKAISSANTTSNNYVDTVKIEWRNKK